MCEENVWSIKFFVKSKMATAAAVAIPKKGKDLGEWAVPGNSSHMEDWMSFPLLHNNSAAKMRVNIVSCYSDASGSFHDPGQTRLPT